MKEALRILHLPIITKTLVDAVCDALGQAAIKSIGRPDSSKE